MRGLTRVFLAFRLILVLMPLPLWTQSSLFLIPELPLVDTIAFLQVSDGGVIAVPEVHKLLTKIHNILDSALSNQTSNMGHISVYPFNSTSRQHCEVLVSSSLSLQH